VSKVWAITGGGGFIGRHLLDALRAQGHEVRVLGERLSDDHALAQLVRGADVVAHLAAYVHRPVRTPAERRACYETNVEGTRKLVDAMAATCPRGLLISLSSSSVYPASEVAMDESTPPGPRSAYGQTKLEAERIVGGAVDDWGLAAVVLRPGMVFGPDGPGNLPRLAKLVRRGLVVELGGGRSRKSLVPVEMVVQAVLGVADHRDRTQGRTFNVGGSSMSFRQLTDLMISVYHREAWRLPLPLGPTLAGAGILDAAARFLRLPAPSLHQLVLAYGTSSILNDAALREFVPLGDDASVEAALRRTVTAI
jgi:UDP-glucose 4-epimerase